MTFEQAAEAWKKHRESLPAAVAGPIASLDQFFGVPLRRLPPDKWKVGDIVEYERSGEWTWCKGTKGQIVEIHRDHRDREPTEYQVFWVVPLQGSGKWWTTPADVQFVERPE